MPTPMHIHEAYTNLIAWLDTPTGLAGLAHYVRRRRNLDEVRGQEKAQQILRDLREDKLYMRDLRLLAAFCVDQLLGLAFAATGDPMRTFPVRDAVVAAAGGWDKVDYETEMWTEEQRARFEAQQAENATPATE